MIGMKSTFEADFEDAKFDVVVPKFKQEMSEAALCKIIGEYSHLTYIIELLVTFSQA